jgi:hypothetical protein
MRLRDTAAVLLLFAAAAVADAEFHFSADHLRDVPALSDETYGRAYLLTGRVLAGRRGIFHLEAARAVLWIDPLAVERVRALAERAGPEAVPAWAVRAVYAEGGATPAKFQTEGRNFRCSSFFYDFREHKGVILDAELRLEVASEEGDVTPVALRARKLRATGAGELRAEDVRLFATEYHEPKIELRVKRVRIVDPAIREALRRLDRVVLENREDLGGPSEAELEEALRALEAAAGKRAGIEMRLERVTLRALDVPLFGWPSATWRGRKSPVRWELDVGKRGQLNEGFRLGVGTEVSAFGETLRWAVGAGYYDHRGPLLDAEWALAPDGGRVSGLSYGVYLRDHGTDFGIEPPTRDRFWTKHQYRLLLGPAWRLDGELALLSDATWLRSFDEREFKEGKEQETLLYLRGRGEPGYVTVTGKTRAIDFLDVLEEAPRLSAALPALTLFTVARTRVQLAATAEAGNLRRRAGDGAAGGDFRTARVDLEPRVYADFGLGPLRLVPSASVRYTGYERTPGDEAWESRVAGLASLRAATQASRFYGGFLHLLDVSLEYESLFAVSVDAAALFPLDDVDRLAPYDVLGARLRNRVQRRTPRGMETLFDLELFAAWFPGGERPLGARGDGLLETEAEWTPFRGLELRARTSLDLERGRLDTASCDAYWRLRPDVRAGAGIRHLDADSDIVTSVVEFDVDTRWRVLAFSQFDLRAGDALDQGVLVQRLGQSLAAGVRIVFDPGDEDFSLGVKLDLLAAYRKERRREAARDEFRWR